MKMHHPNRPICISSAITHLHLLPYTNGSHLYGLEEFENISGIANINPIISTNSAAMCQFCSCAKRFG